MKDKPEAINRLRGLSVHQLLALIGHAPEIKNIERIDKKAKLVDLRRMLEMKNYREKEEELSKDAFRAKVENIKGKRFRDYIRDSYDKGKKEEREELARQMGSILGFLHKNGFSHNDFHPTNFLVEEKEGKVKLKVIDNETINLFVKDWGTIKEDHGHMIFDIHPSKEFQRDFEGILYGMETKTRREMMPIIFKEYERELNDHALKFRGKEIHKMRRKRFVRDVK